MSDRTRPDVSGPERRTSSDDRLIVDEMFYLLVKAAEESEDGKSGVISQDRADRWIKMLLGVIRRKPMPGEDIYYQKVAKGMHKLLNTDVNDPVDVVDPSLASDVDAANVALEKEMNKMPETEEEIVQAMLKLAEGLSDDVREKVTGTLNDINVENNA